MLVVGDMAMVGCDEKSDIKWRRMFQLRLARKSAQSTKTPASSRSETRLAIAPSLYTNSLEVPETMLAFDQSKVDCGLETGLSFIPLSR